MKEKVRKNGQAREVWRRLRKSRSAMLGLFIFSFFLFLAIFGTVLIPYSKSLDINVLERL